MKKQSTKQGQLFGSLEVTDASSEIATGLAQLSDALYRAKLTENEDHCDSALAAICALIGMPLYKFVSGYLPNDKHLWLTAVHDTLMELVKAQPDSLFFQLRKKPKVLRSWIFSVARNKAADAYRAECRHSTRISLSESPEEWVDKSHRFDLENTWMVDALAQLLPTLQGQQKLVAEVIMMLLPDKIGPLKIQKELVESGNHITTAGVKRALEEVRRKLHGFLADERI